MTAPIGSTATFTVDVFVWPPPATFEWRHNGLPIAGSDSRTLTISPVRASDAGTYDVLVRNFAGAALSARATLTVGTPLEIVVQPTSMDVVAGSTGVFRVAANGDGLRYQWITADDPSQIGVNSTTLVPGATAGATTGSTLAVNFASRAAGTHPAFACFVTDERGSFKVSSIVVANVNYGELYRVSTFAGNLPAAGALRLNQENHGYQDGTASDAKFYSPSGVAVDAHGTVYVCDSENKLIRKITATGEVSTLAGGGRKGGADDGFGADAGFALPDGIAVDQGGNVYVADKINATIRKITAAGLVSTLAGKAGSTGSADGIGANARFDSPQAVAVDLAGNVYVADTGNSTIRKITPVGEVSTLAGAPGKPAVVDGLGANARFDQPTSIAVDSAGTIIVGEYETIRRISPSGLVSTLAGTAGAHGSFDNPIDGIGREARFAGPAGICIGSDGTIYVSDTGTYTIRKISPDGVVSTIAGRARFGRFGSEVYLFQGSAVDGDGGFAEFSFPRGIAVDSSGRLYVADRNNNVIRRLSPAPGTPSKTQSGLRNFSARASTGNGPQTFVIGLTIVGNGTQTVLLRGIGPGLVPFGIVNATADPALQVYNGSSSLVMQNDDWTEAATSSSAFASVGAFGLASNSRDAAIRGSLPPGNYHTVVSAKGAGVALAEAYDASTSDTGTAIVNGSARASVGTGNNVLIAGFSIDGANSRTILIRGTGPALKPFAVSDAIATPRLSLYAQGQVMTNAGWGNDPVLAQAAARAGAFALPFDSADDALLVTLPPGTYTAQLATADGSTGTGLLEVYLMP